jgi:hypothetical protein
MHERQAALIGAILALMLLAATPTRAEKDAATKAREGDINHWIEYYQKNRQQTQPVAPAPQGAAEKGKEQEKSRAAEIKKP